MAIEQPALATRTGRILRIAQRAGGVIGYLAAGLFTLWASLALALDLPISWMRIPAVVLYLVGIVAFFWFLRRSWTRALACLFACCCVLAWWLMLKPTNDGPWQPDVAKTAWAEVYGNRVIIHNFRSCDYRAELDYTCQWLTRTVKLDQIRGVDLFMNYWGSPWIAHTILSFDLEDGTHVAFSIETRKRPGQTYSALRGFFRQYTLISVVSDERDLVRLRTNYRHGEDLYLFHTNATPDFARSLFLNYLQLTDHLHDKAEWYNAVTRNCTTEIYTLRTMRSQPLDWRILLNGKADEMEYQRGALADAGLPWQVLKQRAYINPAARAADKDPDFSARIRENRPGFVQGEVRPAS
jgi:Domain of unknown function (DUF4105)